MKRMKKLIYGLAVLGLASVTGWGASPEFKLVSLLPANTLPLWITNTGSSNLPIATFGKVDVSGMGESLIYAHVKCTNGGNPATSNTIFILTYSYDGSNWIDHHGTNWWHLQEGTSHLTNLWRPPTNYAVTSDGNIYASNLAPRALSAVKWVRVKTITPPNAAGGIYITNMGFVGWK